MGFQPCSFPQVFYVGPLLMAPKGGLAGGGYSEERFINSKKGLFPIGVIPSFPAYRTKKSSVLVHF